MERREIQKREKLLDRVYAGDTQSWAYSWSVAKWRNGRLSVLPTIPMVENLGTVTGGAHAPEWGWTQPTVQRMTFPLRHPPEVQADPRVDRLWANQFAPSMWARAVKRARHLLGVLR